MCQLANARYEWLHFYLVVGSVIQPLKTPPCYFTQFLLSATENKMKSFLIAVIAFASFLTASVAFACPLGTHPVCTYDGTGQSHCHCVP